MVKVTESGTELMLRPPWMVVTHIVGPPSNGCRASGKAKLSSRVIQSTAR